METNKAENQDVQNETKSAFNEIESNFLLMANQIKEEDSDAVERVNLRAFLKRREKAIITMIQNGAKAPFVLAVCQKMGYYKDADLDFFQPVFKEMFNTYLNACSDKKEFELLNLEKLGVKKKDKKENDPNGADGNKPEGSRRGGGKKGGKKGGSNENDAAGTAKPDEQQPFGLNGDGSQKYGADMLDNIFGGS